MTYYYVCTQGPGWIKLEGMYTEKDVEMARERVLHHVDADYYMKK